MPVLDIQEQIAKDLTDNPIVLYMKGTRLMPQCGYSAKVVQILEELDIDYAVRNVLDDDTLRQGIKEYSNWPTLPQLFVNGELIGGCDIITQLHESGELRKILSQVC